HLTGFHIQLTIHNTVYQVQHSHIHPLLLQSISCFQSQQAAPNPDGVLLGFAVIQHAVNILNIPEANHAFKFSTRNWRYERFGTGREDQTIISNDFAFSGMNLFTRTVDSDGSISSDESNAFFGIPVG